MGTAPGVLGLGVGLGLLLVHSIGIVIVVVVVVVVWGRWCVTLMVVIVLILAFLVLSLSMYISLFLAFMVVELVTYIWVTAGTQQLDVGDSNAQGLIVTFSAFLVSVIQLLVHSVHGHHVHVQLLQCRLQIRSV